MWLSGDGRAGRVAYEGNQGAFWVMGTFTILIMVMFNRYIYTCVKNHHTYILSMFGLLSTIPHKDRGKAKGKRWNNSAPIAFPLVFHCVHVSMVRSFPFEAITETTWSRWDMSARQSWWDPAVLLTQCITLGRLLRVLRPHFPLYKIELIICPP